MSSLMHQGRATYAFFERNWNLTRRYWGWELVWLVYNIVNAMSVTYIGLSAELITIIARQSPSGDALNLTTGRDPRRLGHIRLFEAWANAEHSAMWVYEETPPKVVHRVVAYDDRYQPIRLAGLSGAGEVRLVPGTPAPEPTVTRRPTATRAPTPRPTVRPTPRPSATVRPTARPTGAIPTPAPTVRPTADP